MASIIKRKKNYSVIYNYVDENGETKQKWETWGTHKEALKRKAEIENQQHTGTFLPPSNQKISDFLYDFVSLYGEKKWGVSMYDSQNSLINNYINPIIGDMEVQAVTPRVVDGSDLAKDRFRFHKDAQGDNDLCQQPDHREDHKTYALCVQTGGAVGDHRTQSLRQCGASENGVQKA